MPAPALSLPLLDPAPVKLREGGNKSQHQRIQWRRAVAVHGDPLRNELDRCTLLGDLLHQGVEIPRIAAVQAADGSAACAASSSARRVFAPFSLVA